MEPQTNQNPINNIPKVKKRSFFGILFIGGWILFLLALFLVLYKLGIIETPPYCTNIKEEQGVFEIPGDAKVVNLQKEYIEDFQRYGNMVNINAGEKVQVKDTPLIISFWGYSSISGWEGGKGPVYNIKGDDEGLYSESFAGSGDKCSAYFEIYKHE